jgi:hypothetical protein
MGRHASDRDRGEVSIRGAHHEVVQPNVARAGGGRVRETKDSGHHVGPVAGEHDRHPALE